MLSIEIPEGELFDETKGCFIYTERTILRLEHSLVSMAKWESKWCKPFLEGERTVEESIDYIRCMTITQNVDPNVYLMLTDKNIEEVSQYINEPMTATTFRDESKGGGNKTIITSELIYYSMIAYRIPFECQKWHLNRLLTLIKVCDIKSNPPKKMSYRETTDYYKKVNEIRKKQLNTRG